MITNTDPKIFSNGLDLEYLAKNGEEAGLRSIRGLNFLLADLLSYPIPVVAAMQGHAFAGGAWLALA